VNRECNNKLKGTMRADINIYYEDEPPTNKFGDFTNVISCDNRLRSKVKCNHGYRNKAIKKYENHVKNTIYKEEKLAKENIRKAEEEKQREANAKKWESVLAWRKRFEMKNDIKHWPSIKELYVNPFVFENNNVAIVLKFKRMLSATTGMFEYKRRAILIYNIPKGRFVKSSTVLLAGRVKGNTVIDTNIGGKLTVPKIEYKEVYFCKKSYCDDIVLRNNR